MAAGVKPCNAPEHFGVEEPVLLKVAVPVTLAQCACLVSLVTQLPAAASHSHVTELLCIYDVLSLLPSSSNLLSIFNPFSLKSSLIEKCHLLPKWNGLKFTFPGEFILTSYL